ncbi:MAG: hydrogenase iron-sulfur subunit, partial [Anaerolineae bacterium]|nr:hydrogenase iron-sulfur subunit [Anaerolineae bacterium]
KAFISGADGVMVLACHIGDCHYDSGNHRTAKRIPLLRNLLIYMGIEPDRLRLDWVSASESPKFAQVTSEFVEDVRKLGPLQTPFRVPRSPITETARGGVA